MSCGLQHDNPSKQVCRGCSAPRWPSLPSGSSHLPSVFPGPGRQPSLGGPTVHTGVVPAPPASIASLLPKPEVKPAASPAPAPPEAAAAGAAQPAAAPAAEKIQETVTKGISKALAGLLASLEVTPAACPELAELVPTLQRVAVQLTPATTQATLSSQLSAATNYLGQLTAQVSHAETDIQEHRAVLAQKEEALAELQQRVRDTTAAREKIILQLNGQTPGTASAGQPGAAGPTAAAASPQAPAEPDLVATTLSILREAFTAGPLVAFPDMESKYDAYVAECKATGVQAPLATEWLWKEGGRQLVNQVAVAARRGAVPMDEEPAFKRHQGGGVTSGAMESGR